MNLKTALYIIPILAFELSGAAMAQPAEPVPGHVDEPGMAEQTSAEQDEPALSGKAARLRLKPNAKWHILGHALATPAYFLSQITIHEGSHAIAAAASGGEITSFQPYPHMVGDNFVFGSTESRGKFSDAQIGLILAAPLMTDALVFTASDLLLTYAIDDDSPAAPFLLMGGMIVPLVDFLVNVNGPSATNDTSKWSKMAGLPRWSTALMGDALAAVAVWRIVHHGYRIFFEHEGATAAAVPTLSIAPTFTPGGGGLTIAGRF